MLEKKPGCHHPETLAFYAIETGGLIVPEVVAISRNPGADQIISPEDPADWPIGNWTMLQERLGLPMNLLSAI